VINGTEPLLYGAAQAAEGHDWSHDALHGLAQVARAIRAGRAAGAISEPEERRVAAMLYDLEQMVIARGVLG